LIFPRLRRMGLLFTDRHVLICGRYNRPVSRPERHDIITNMSAGASQQ
jgi:hypothetical protein